MGVVLGKLESGACSGKMGYSELHNRFGLSTGSDPCEMSPETSAKLGLGSGIGFESGWG